MEWSHSLRDRGLEQGTFAIAKAVAEGGGLSIIGGETRSRRSIKAVMATVTFMSTGGGACLTRGQGIAWRVDSRSILNQLPSLKCPVNT